MAYETAIAQNRFGLGARPDEAALVQPRRWLLEQLASFQPRPPALAGVITSGQAAARLDSLPASIDALYAAAIATLDRAVADAPLFVHYLDDPEEVDTAALRSDIYLPLA